MGRRSNDIQSRNRAMLSVFAPPIVLFLLLVGGLYYYYYVYEGSSSTSAYDAAVAECVRDRTRITTDAGAQERATSDCVRDTPVDQ